MDIFSKQINELSGFIPHILIAQLSREVFKHKLTCFYFFSYSKIMTYEIFQKDSVGNILSCIFLPVEQ